MADGRYPELVHYLRDVSFYDEEGPILGAPAYWMHCEEQGRNEDLSGGGVALYDHRTGKGLAFTIDREQVTCKECKGNAAEKDTERENTLGQQYPWVVVELSEQVLNYCDQLKEVGLWGTSRDEVIERLVCRQLEKFIHEGRLSPPGEEEKTDG